MVDLLTCSHLTKVYPEEKAKALSGVSFSINANGIFALIGRNGAGKTTLTRILATELMPTSGKAMMDGLDVVEDAVAVREQIAILPQEARAIQWLTPRQTIVSYLLYRGFSLRDANAKVKPTLKRLGIEKYENSLNRNLSGGLKRKVLVATVLAADSKIIFVDEPTTGLDPLSRADLWRTLNSLKKDHFIFLTTHYLEEAEKLADRIGILDEGKLVGIGTLTELRKKVKYQYSLKVLQQGVRVKPRAGDHVVGADGFTQIFTTEDEANRLAKELIQKRIRIAINPINLEDIFYHLVKKPIESEEQEEEEW